MTALYQPILTWLEEYNKAHEGAVELRLDEPMSRHTSFKIGGAADLYLLPQDRQSLMDLCRKLREYSVPAYYLGNGSNVIFDDEGFRGAVVGLSKCNAITVDGDEIVAEAGATVASLAKTARDHALSGLEFSYGIPGSVGGAVTMNAGAYGGEISFVLKESTYLDLADGSVHTISLSEHAYGYRESVYKHNDFVILSARFALQKGERELISETMNDYMNRRVTKQPLEYPSAGSVFKRYPGRYTGQMIDEAGLKGYTIGGAQVSEKHAGFIINVGSATAQDVLALIEHVKSVIFEKFGCKLECEVIYVPSCNPLPKE